MRLLLVEDDAMIGESLHEALVGENYAVDWVRDGRSAELALGNDVYDLLLLDLGLPKKQGLQVLSEYRQRGGMLPVLIITARDATADRVSGLDAGADDYLVKPFDLDELFARVRALLRRQAGRAQPIIAYGGVTLNPASREVFLNGSVLNLSAREFALLQALLDPPERVLSLAELEEKLYGWDQEIGSNAVEVYIHHLRKKLGTNFIRNVRGVGYKVAAI
ncbi:response regulator [Sulfuriferula nivalis]|uniref:DNA-binding response regulator n=1 Tax=Sulfuriferula nivalis TaxID=2675298 RepID=A0A809RDB5_9PROT|nr:response regulator [Sulfuriferula nivalis]BBO99634.1 DNA-binding response regulator [Sulfuriferula nivalis]